VLIRALEDESGEVVEGSCLCVDAILNGVGLKSVPELADDLLAGDLHVGSPKSALRIEVIAKPRTSTVNRSMRVGNFEFDQLSTNQHETFVARYRSAQRSDVEAEREIRQTTRIHWRRVSIYHARRCDSKGCTASNDFAPYLSSFFFFISIPS
jgi:hypothetical protein